jgi:hypothetical protein
MLRYNLILIYATRFCVNWAFLIAREARLKYERSEECQKRPNLHTNELNTTFFCSTSPLKAPNRLKSLKLA